MNAPLRLALVDDHGLCRQALSDLLTEVAVAAMPDAKAKACAPLSAVFGRAQSMAALIACIHS